jgi:hypothetical protein
LLKIVAFDRIFFTGDSAKRSVSARYDVDKRLARVVYFGIKYSQAGRTIIFTWREQGHTRICLKIQADLMKFMKKALTNALGMLGMVKFIRQYDRGEGDYTKERHTWLDGLSMEDFDRWLNRRRTETEDITL